MAGAKAMAASALDLFLDPKLVATAKETFQEEIGDTEYRPLLPPDQKPPLGLNRRLSWSATGRRCANIILKTSPYSANRTGYALAIEAGRKRSYFSPTSAVNVTAERISTVPGSTGVGAAASASPRAAMAWRKTG